MRITAVAAVLACFLFVTTASAEFYKYRDANGVLRFTDNIAEVPVDQRPKIKQYEEATDYMTQEQKAAKEEADAKAAKDHRAKLDAMLSSGKNEAPEDVNDPGFVDYLNRTKVQLDNEYAGLMREKDELNASRASLKTESDIKDYQEKAKDLNARIKAFNLRRDEYKAKADAFNQGAQPK